jgi:hypothetical protein
LDSGLKSDDPSLLDSLSILALAFEAQGRLDELSALFGSQEASGPAAPLGAAPPESPQDAAAGPPGPPAPPEGPAAAPDQAEEAPSKPIDLEEARALYAELSGAHPESGVLPALALGMINQITGEASPPCSGPFSVDHYQELLALCQVLAQGYGRLGMEGEMERILEGFSALVPPPKAAPGTAASRYRVEELLAALKTKNGDDAAAEAALRRAVALSQDEEAEADPGARADKILLGHLRLADNLLAQGRPPVEAEVELMAAIAQAEKILGRNRIDERPMAALAFLRLGQLLKTMNRSRDSRDFLTRTERAIKNGSAAHPESAEWYKGLGTLAGQIASASARNAGRYDLSLLYRVSLPADKPHRDPSSPEVMRLELTALKLLGRVNDFRPMIELAMETAADRDGVGSPAHRRYQSLWMKFLEESGDIRSLIAALDELAQNPGLPPGRDSLAIKTSALRYKARVLIDHGYSAEAANALNDARNLLLSEPLFADRLREIEIDLQRLSGATSRGPAAPAPPPSDEAAGAAPAAGAQ